MVEPKENTQKVTTRTKENHSCSKVNENTMQVDKVSFIAFMAEVINCTAQTESRTEKIRIIIGAAGKHLKTEEVTVEQINERIKVQNTNSQAACGGS